MESYNPENRQEKPQEVGFDSEKVITSEKTALEKYEGKVGQAARAFLLVSRTLKAEEGKDDLEIN